MTSEKSDYDLKKDRYCTYSGSASVPLAARFPQCRGVRLVARNGQVRPAGTSTHSAHPDVGRQVDGLADHRYQVFRVSKEQSPKSLVFGQLVSHLSQRYKLSEYNNKHLTDLILRRIWGQKKW